MKDDRKQVVTALGTVLTALAAVAFLPVEPGEPDAKLLKPIFPLVRDSMDDLGKTGIREGIEVEFACRAVSINPPQNLGMTVDKPRCGKITYHPIPKDAVLRL